MTILHSCIESMAFRQMNRLKTLETHLSIWDRGTTQLLKLTECMAVIVEEPADFFAADIISDKELSMYG